MEHGCPQGRSKNGCARKNALPWGYLQEWIACEQKKQTNFTALKMLSCQKYMKMNIPISWMKIQVAAILKSNMLANL